MTLEEKLKEINAVQARRYDRLTGQMKEIARKGIIRHLQACAAIGANPDVGAVREIIDDAQNGRAVYEERTP